MSLSKLMFLTYTILLASTTSAFAGNKNCTIEISSYDNININHQLLVKALKRKNFKFVTDNNADYSVVYFNTSCVSGYTEGAKNYCDSMSSALEIKNNITGRITNFSGQDDALFFQAKENKAISDLMKSVPRCN